LSTALKSKDLLRFVGASNLPDPDEYVKNAEYDLIWDGIEHAREENKKERNNLELLRQAFECEKRDFLNEMKAAHKKLSADNAKLKADNALLEQKRSILERGFHQLDVDKKKLAEDKRLFELKLKTLNKTAKPRKVYDDYFWDENAEEESAEEIYKREARAFFAGVTNPLALRKRYKELIKIFHPDNFSGDNATLLMINKEYEALKLELG